MMDLWECPVIVRCSVASCSAIMPGQSLNGVDGHAVVFVQDIAPGWIYGTAELASGKRRNVVLCPKHAHVCDASARVLS